MRCSDGNLFAIDVWVIMMVEICMPFVWEMNINSNPALTRYGEGSENVRQFCPSFKCNDDDVDDDDDDDVS